jgi:mRNA-degrading endonuclease toxin of MazEF toxin-antitoxin module
MMNSYDCGDVVVVLFPTTDGSVAAKKRPALVIRKNGREDLLLCMMTTVSRGEPEEVNVQAGEANLKKNTYIRTHKMMTVHESFISGTTGKVSDATWQKVIQTIKAWLN